MAATTGSGQTVQSVPHHLNRALSGNLVQIVTVSLLREAYFSSVKNDKHSGFS